MAANEKFILEFVTKGVDGIDKAQQKIGDLNGKVNGLASALLGVSFATFIGGALQAADRISDFSDATNISIASLKGLEAAMNAAGGNGKNLEKAINQLYASMDTANQGSLQARDAFAKVGVSLNDLKNASEADILQKTLEGLAQMPAGAERSATAATLLSKSFRSIDPKQLLEALDPSKYAASEEATKKAAAAQQKLDEAFKSLQEGAINALEPILNLMGEAKLTTEAATKIVQGLGVAFAVLFGAQAIASIGAAVGVLLKLNTALRGTAVAQAILQGLQGPKGWAVLAAGAAASAAAIYGINKALEGTDENAKAAADAVSAVNAAAGVDTLSNGKIVQANPQAGAAGRDQGLDARQKAAMESNKRIAEANANVRKELAIRTASDLEKIDIEAEIALQRAKEEIYSKENLSKVQKDKEYAAVAKSINEKSTSDFIAMQKQQQQQVDQIKIGYMDQISQMLGYEKSETQRINDLIAQQPEKYKEIGDQMRTNAALQDQNLATIKKFNEEQARSKELFKEAFDIGYNFQDQQRKITTEAERRLAISQATSQAEKNAIDEQFNSKSRISDLISQDLQNEKLRAAILSDLEGDATGEQVQRILDHIEKIRLLQDQEGILSGLRLKYANEEYDRQRTFDYGWTEAFKKYKESALDAGSQAQTYFETFTGGMEDAMVKFVQTGKLSFKDLANSIIADFVRIQTRKLITGVFGGGDIFGGLFGGGRAAGGAVNAGTSYMVGERGPELFVPMTAGKIVPNYSMGSSNQPQQMITNVTYSIQAVDASSFRQLVARDPQFIYSVTEKGRRSVPTRR
jgi:lambda family phage tail tape measure protein